MTGDPRAGEHSSVHSTRDDLESEVPEEKTTPLPRFQLFIVALINLAEPLAGCVIYPFINKLVRETGITNGDETKTGYYAGIIESAFFLAECLTVVQWGYLSDRIGRKPVLVFGPLGLALSVLGFGLSKRFWPLVAFRCLQGAFNGNIGVSKSVLAEITDHSNIGDAFAIIPIAWSLGITTAPLIGGYFANPADRLPSTFGRIEFLRRFPYLLPCAIISFFAFGIFVVTLFGLKESRRIRRSGSSTPTNTTHHQREELASGFSDATLNEETPLLVNKVDTYNHTEMPSTVVQEAEEALNAISNPPQADPTLRAILRGPIIFTYINYAFLAFLDICHFSLLPLMYSTSPHLGGLGMEPYSIGMVLMAFGIINAVVQGFLLGPLIRKFGPRKMFMISVSFLPLCFAIYPVMAHLSRDAGGVNAYIVVGIALQLCCDTMDLIAYGSCQILLVRGIPDQHLGIINGIAQMVGSGSRAIGPTFASSLYSVSLSKNLAGGNMVFYILICLSFSAIALSTRLKESRI